MTCHRAVLVAAGALTFLTAWVVVLPPLPVWAGVIVLGLSEDHGVHLSDLPALLSWCVGMVACAALWRRT